MDKDTIIAISQFLIIPFLIAYMNYRGKIKETKAKEESLVKEKQRDEEFEKKIEAKMGVVTNKLGSYELLMTEFEEMLKGIKDLLKTHIGTDDFLDSFANSTRYVSNEILSWAKLIDNDYKIVLSTWCESMIAFGLMYYKDKNRYDDKDVFKNHLSQEIERHEERFYKLNDSLINGMKKHNGNFIRFSKLLKTAKIHQRTDYLIAVLSENGFEKDKEIKHVFVKYIREFYELYFTAVATWEGLELKSNAA